MKESIKAPLNKLWVLPLNEKTEKLSEEYRYFFSQKDHCLIVSEKQPPSSMEATQEVIALLSVHEWQWIYSVHEAIRRDGEDKYQQELESMVKEFTESFLIQLERSRNEQSHTEPGA